MSRVYSNNYLTTLNGAITAVATSIVVSDVTLLPTIGAGAFCYLTIQNGTSLEIVSATANSGTTLTVTRAQEGTSGLIFPSGSTISLRPTAASFNGLAPIASPTFTGTVVLPTPFTIGAVSMTATGTQLNYVDATSSIQTQLNAKQATITQLPVANGGTGLATQTAYSVLCGGTTSTGVMQSLASLGTSGQVLTSGGASALPTWTTIAAGGSGTVNSGTAQQVAYYATPTTAVSGLSTTSSAILTADGSGNLAWVAYTGSGAPVRATSPTLVTPLLGTPTSGVLTNCTGLPLAGGGTGVTAVTIAPTATSFAGWDANSNMSAANFIDGYLTQASGSTITVASKRLQYLTGAGGVTATLPVTSTLVVGMRWKFFNYSSGVWTINASGGGAVIAMPTLTWCEVVCILASGTSAASWATTMGSTNTSNIIWPTSFAHDGFVCSSGSNNTIQYIGNTGLSVPKTNSSTTIGMAASGTANQVLNVNSGATDVAFTSTLTNITLVTPALGTPSSGVLSSCSAYAQSALTGLGTGVSTFLGTPSSANLLAALTDKTGTGSVVFATSPTFVTPVLGAAAATSLSFSSTSGIIGTTTNDSASAGSVGELLNSTYATGVSVSSGVTTQLNSLALTAGDWDIWAVFGVIPAGTTVVNTIVAGIDITTATLTAPTSPVTSAIFQLLVNLAAGGAFYAQTGTARLSLAAGATYYLNVNISFTVSTATTQGQIYARRRR